METAQANISGPEKAVLFLLSLEEEIAGPIIHHLQVDELRQLRRVAAGMHEVTSASLDATYAEYVTQTDETIAVPRGGVPYLKRLTASTFGAGIANDVFSDGNKTSLQRLEGASPDALAPLLAGESSQLVAAILAQLDAKTGYSVLATFAPEKEAEILAAMGKMSELPAGVLEGVAHALAEELPVAAEGVISLDGVSTAADILKAAGRDASAEILEKIEAAEPDLARDMRLAMFTFEELTGLDPRSMRTLLREVATDRLTLALKDASEEVARNIFSGLSERAAKLIKDDLEVLGKVRKSDVDASRQEIVQVAMRLEGEGQIDLGRGEE